MTEVQVKMEAPALPAEKNEKKQNRNSGRRRNKSDEVKREFIKFATELRKQYGEDTLTFQISNHPVGLEFSLRVDKKKELTVEQKAKRAEKQAKRREYVEKKRQETLEKNAEDEIVKEVPTGIAVG